MRDESSSRDICVPSSIRHQLFIYWKVDHFEMNVKINL